MRIVRQTFPDALALLPKLSAAPEALYQCLLMAESEPGHFLKKIKEMLSSWFVKERDPLFLDK